MKNVYKERAQENTNNVSLKTDLLDKEAVERWDVENQNAIEAYNNYVDENGCFGDEFRTF